MSEGQAGLAIKPQANNQGILRLLLLEESASAAQSLIDPLRDAGYAVTAARVKSPLEFQAALKKQEWDLIFSPLSLANFNAKQALALLSHAKIDTPCIIISDNFTDEEFTEALRCGARALTKRNHIDQLLLTVQRELRDLAMRRARHHYEKMFRQSERRCQILLESSLNAIACVRNGKVIYANPAFNKLTSKHKEHGSSNITGIIHPDDRQRFEQLLKGVETGKNLSDKTDLRVLDENDKPLLVKVEAIVAYVNEQQCAQISISLNADSGDTTEQTPIKLCGDASIQHDSAQAPPDKQSTLPGDDDPGMRQQLSDALLQGRFRLVYQPIVPLHAQPAERYEVLIRMIDENGEEIAPASFMPAAEKAGLMPEIDRWVIRASMETLIKQHKDKKETSLLVKLSEDSLGDQTLVPWINERLNEFHLPGDTLIFEIKEAHILHQPEAAKQLINGLKQLHCRTALGHFGSDPRSLDHLEQLHVDFVKLAGNFVDNLSGDSKSQAMVKAVVQTAHDLGTLTVATFVQDASKMATLWQCNVDYIQGYFLQAPDQDMTYNFSEQQN
jgi:EAL domain-containing protein (putative c-di-GMP-specific phosphodiesterase class I)/DNA-binding NarL/FixJ family response regulator